MFQRSFRFHKFEDEKSSPYDFSQSTGFQNFRTNQKLSNTYYNNNFNTNDSINIPSQNNYNSFRESYSISSPINISNNINNNNNERLLIPDFSNYNQNMKFPLNNVLTLDFRTILKNGNLSIINKYLPDMIYKSIEFENENPYVKSIISKSQKLLNYLFQLQSDILSSNNNLENFIKLPNSDLNNRTKELNNKKENNNKKINQNEQKRRELQIKMNLYKNVILTSGNGNLIPQQNLPLDIHDQNGIFYCDICPDKKFKSYEKVHEHYVKRHLNLDKLRGGGNLFLNFENNYFENKLKIIKEELSSTIKELNKTKKLNKTQKINKIKELNESTNFPNRNNIFRSQNIQINKYFNNSIISQQNINSLNDEVNKQLEELSSEQQKDFESFTNQFENFKIDIFKQLDNIMKGKNISIENNLRYRKGGNVYNIIYENGKRKEKIINEVPSFRNSKQNTFNKYNNNNLNNNPKIDYQENDVVKRGTDIMNNLYNKNTNKVFFESIEVNDNNNNNNNEIQLRGIRKSYQNDSFENLKKKYKEREDSVLFNNKLTTTQSVLEEYNFLNLEPSKKQEKELKNKIKEYNEMFGLDPNDNNEKLSKVEYEKIINNLFKISVDKSKNDLFYSKYKSNIFSINEIEKEILNLPETNEQIYEGLDKDEIYDIINDDDY